MAVVAIRTVDDLFTFYVGIKVFARSVCVVSTIESLMFAPDGEFLGRKQYGPSRKVPWPPAGRPTRWPS